MWWDRLKSQIIDANVSTEEEAHDTRSTTEPSFDPSNEQRSNQDLKNRAAQGRDVSVSPVLLQHYVGEANRDPLDPARWDPRTSTSGDAILSSPQPQRRAYVRLIVERIVERPSSGETEPLRTLLSYLLRRKNQWDESSLRPIVDLLAGYPYRHLWPLPTAGIVRLAESFLECNRLTPEFDQSLQNLGRLYKIHAASGDERQLYRRIHKLLDGADSEGPLEFDTGEAWTETLAKQINAMPQSAATRWKHLLDHASTLRSPRPSRQWIQGAISITRRIDSIEFLSVVKQCLSAVGQPGDPSRFQARFEHRSHPTQVHEQYSDLLRGLVWCASATEMSEFISVFGQCAEVCFDRLPRQRPRSLKVAFACITAIGGHRSDRALAELNRLLSLARQASVKSRITKEVDELCDGMNTRPYDLTTRSVPDFGLSDVGISCTIVGEHAAQIAITSPGVVRLTWQRGDQEPTRTTPALIKSFDDRTLQQLKKRAQDILSAIPGQKLRLERMLTHRAEWSYRDFLEHYIDHRFVGPFARCLIWRFSSGEMTDAAIWMAGRWKNVSGESLEWIDQATRVSPWHPVTTQSDQVIAWQRMIEDRIDCQPFKQAHREIYRRTSSEVDEDLESRRFTGHFVDPYRLQRVASARGWKLSECHDDSPGHSPSLDLPQWNMRAILHTVPNPAPHPVRDPWEPNVGSVRFARTDTPDAIPLIDVPDLVYSEVMREVECYLLQYASLGNFPVYGSPESTDPLQEYWQKTAYGPLTEQGRTRRRLLERLIPKSNLAGRCHIDGDFLVVQGEWNCYHIHLSSGNVQLGPDRQDFDAFIIPFSERHTGLPPGAAFPPLPFGGDVRLASILNLAAKLSRESKLTHRWLLDRLAEASD